MAYSSTESTRLIGTTNLYSSGVPTPYTVFLRSYRAILLAACLTIFQSKSPVSGLEIATGFLAKFRSHPVCSNSLRADGQKPIAGPSPLGQRFGRA